MEPILLRLGNEVRQSLHHIHGLVGLTMEEPLSDSQLDYLRRCREAADQLLQITADLAELARPGGSGAPAVAFDTVEAITEIVELMGVLAEGKGLSLDWTPDPQLPGRILGDRCLLQDTLRRALDNAIRYTLSGTIRLSVSYSGATGSSALTLEISDTGTGVPQSVLEDLDGDVSNPRLQGLSLRIVRKRLANLGGAMSISPNSPKGTSVRIHLPIVLVPAGTDDPPVLPSGSPHPLRLLVVEDSDNSFFLFSSYVESEGHQVSRAFDGAEAIEMAKQGGWDLIIMDVNMPRLDGYSATRLIREWETGQGTAHVPVLLLSGDDLERQLRKGGAAGCSGYLTKPATKEQVLAALSFYAVCQPTTVS